MKKITNFLTASLLAVIMFVGSTSTVIAAQLGERTLKIGSTGEDVQVLQSKLEGLGLYSGTIDGVFNESTRQAVINYQTNTKITVDGIVGPQTVAALQSAEKTSRSVPFRYKKVLDIVATAYAPGPHDNGKWGNLTHIGTTVRPGIIAVDPKVIPLRSRVYIEFADGHGVYAIAEDTGGAIKGNRIDIAMWTVDEAYKFGIQNVKVYVLE